jgi:signal transduction histidine kinase
MSQEIRTPMNGVTGTINLLRDPGATEEQREYFDIIQSCGESLPQLPGKLHRRQHLSQGSLC